MIFFSIITICRNNLDELKATFESVQSQTINDFEWIVVDGDSTDGTKDWLKNNPFKSVWVSEKDDGIFDAMNKGIALSKGKFLIFMNSGDKFADSQVLYKIHNSLKKFENDPTFIYGDSFDVDEKGKLFHRKAKSFNSIKYGMITQHQAMLFNKFKIRDLKFLPEYSLTADYALVCDTIKKSNPADIIQLDFAFCRFSMGGTNESSRFKALKEDFRIRRKILKINFPESLLLFFLHYFHTIVKKILPSFRFIKHDLIT